MQICKQLANTDESSMHRVFLFSVRTIMSVKTLSECIRGSVVSLVVVEHSQPVCFWAQSQLHWGIFLYSHNSLYICLARGLGLCVCTTNVIQGRVEQENTKPLC